ncbi:MAG TPA: condensation domain-containing protein, partial [Candidatus Angelobacter sp.]|nr:condensation domain-containing protein [Candidatus Angelobacter sp.]
LIEPQLCVNIPFEDLSWLEADAREEAVHAAMRRELQEPFDLAQGPLLRLKILKVAVDEHILLRTLHHIVCDGWSQGIFNQELTALYAAYREARENPLSPLPVQYADFTLWQRRWLEGCEMESLLAYWKQQLAGMPPRLELPADRVCVARAFAADVVQMSLPSDQVAALKRLSHQNQTTLYMTLVAGLALLLSRYSGQDDIVIGAPIANRQDAHLEEMIGFFVNSLALRVRLKPDMSLRALLAQVRQTALEAYQHQDLPFARLVQELSPQRTVNTTPIFQVQMVLQNAPLHPLRLEGLQVELMKAVERHVRFDLEIHVIEQNSNLMLMWLYKRGLFDSWRIEQMARHFSGVLEMMVENAD